jgi:GNAT superfamily N-acetyltransferase
MPTLIEVQRDLYTISTDPARLDVEAVCDMLSHAYWATGRPRSRTERALQNSLVFGVYEGTRQVGLARVVSDYSIFAYLCDVYIHEQHRARGLGKWLIETIMAHPDLQGLRRWTLVTLDAHELYRQFGWEGLKEPQGWMEILRPYPGEQ